MTTLGSAVGAIGGSGALDLLCAGTSFQFSAWIQQIKAWKRGRRPPWAA